MDSSMNGGNQLPGVVTDSSYIGVSTQYLVRTAWGQELMVFSQNTGGDDRLSPGDDVVLHWDPAHTFALDATEAIDAGVELEETAERPDPVGAGS
jgi:spermidine/putrescine transport system ATP-binding protein